MPAPAAHDTALDAAPVAWHRPGGGAGLLLLCEHASAHIPPSFQGLGLPASELQRHIAWDIGALALAQGLADRLDAPLAYATYSRLLLDLNRPVEAPDSIVERSEATDIPGNRGLSAAHRQWRQRRIYQPFHAAVDAKVAERRQAGIATVVLSIHSFTPSYHGQARPWHAGVIARGHRRFGDALLDGLRSDTTLCIGDNEPYAPVAGVFHSIERHAERHGLHGAMIEVRQDLLADEPGQAQWAERLFDVLERALPALGNHGHQGARD
jgi:predicted N-formylglutamate amidohydrolase